ncbi:hypothetical protein [Salipiger sp.]|uniref:hypothetical protein n=1 Tax=Salipiger sp. TaxID=2078585 RepID=UPI003A973A05
MLGYVAAGFDPGGFWSLSLREYQVHMRAARVRAEAEQEARAWSAWHAEALRRQKDLPAFRDFVKGKADPPQSPDEQQAFFDLLTGAWGAVPATT